MQCKNNVREKEQGPEGVKTKKYPNKVPQTSSCLKITHNKWQGRGSEWLGWSFGQRLKNLVAVCQTFYQRTRTYVWQHGAYCRRCAKTSQCSSADCRWTETSNSCWNFLFFLWNKKHFRDVVWHQILQPFLYLCLRPLCFFVWQKNKTNVTSDKVIAEDRCGRDVWPVLWCYSMAIGAPPQIIAQEQESYSSRASRLSSRFSSSPSPANTELLSSDDSFRNTF